MSPRRAKSRLVEECFGLDIGELVRGGVLNPDQQEFVAFHGIGSLPAIRLLKCAGRPRVVGGTIRTIELVVQVGSRTGWGPFSTHSLQVDHDRRRRVAKGWAFRCPGVDAENPCGRPFRTLHLPPEGGVFACRACHDLRYLSSRRSDKGVRKLVQDPARVSEEATKALATVARSARPPPRCRLALKAAAVLARCHPEGGPFGWVPPPPPLSPEDLALAEQFNRGRPHLLMSAEEAAEFLERLESAPFPEDDCGEELPPEPR